ncbi:ATP-grasp domain-containing protein [Pedobacter flavus]|uniref:Prokaryotic glutathione synthetase ATP-binding domain-containing protein n=1 Tax=Pedobacter flavus TaxID=3113906 RepID=A0ABU7GXN4_9SPHI|nr:hypothetical protein [Pedobacter sp. VNH31]MEE1883803.1 hypothetical protein [Pedobacter sp. VNH31]
MKLEQLKIAYVCYKDVGTFDSPVEDEESVLFNFLRDKGLQLTKVIWNDDRVDWKSFDLALLKSPWDYFEVIDTFYSWLTHLDEIKLPLLNPTDLVKWNADKHYLAEIADAGLPVIPTAYINKGTRLELETFFERFKTDQIIIKPCVSGGSFHTFKVTKENLEEIQNKVQLLLKTMDFMVQPFIPEVQIEGEWSLLFFNGKFSHCLLKKAKSGDFRVQHFLGGTIHPQQPSEAMLKSAKQYVDQFAKSSLYARVDGVMIDETFTLMELELIEPYMFLFTDVEGYENYYKALKEKMEG